MGIAFFSPTLTSIGGNQRWRQFDDPSTRRVRYQRNYSNSGSIPPFPPPIQKLNSVPSFSTFIARDSRTLISPPSINSSKRRNRKLRMFARGIIRLFHRPSRPLRPFSLTLRYVGLCWISLCTTTRTPGNRIPQASRRRAKRRSTKERGRSSRQGIYLSPTAHRIVPLISYRSSRRSSS